MRVRSEGFSHVGRRSNNEDSFCAAPELGLFVVADGMGGYEGGETASALAVESIRDFVQRNLEDEEATWPCRLDPSLGFAENLLKVAVYLADRRIWACKASPRTNMGTTVAALLLQRGRAALANVGDSRVYRLRGGALQQLSCDHSLYAELCASGMTDIPDRAHCGFSNVITRALGMPQAEPALRGEPLLAGDRFLLCSDGLIESIEDSDLGKLLGSCPAEEAGRRLVDEAYRRGSRDNITAIVVEIEDP